ncbi:MAG: single-stranded DNA-binding protein [Phycisphaerae bacterium]|nr:single-stranded DNA-binding protein [Phycisphaerae bacterium]
MRDLNEVILVGRLTRDAELKATATGTSVLHFSIAVNKPVKKNGEWNEEAIFVNVTVWGKSADAIYQYLGKGKQVAVQGELSQDRWEQDGQRKEKMYVTANHVQLLGSLGPKKEPPKQVEFDDDVPF